MNFSHITSIEEEREEKSPVSFVKKRKMNVIFVEQVKLS